MTKEKAIEEILANLSGLVEAFKPLALLWIGFQIWKLQLHFKIMMEQKADRDETKELGKLHKRNEERIDEIEKGM